MQSAPGEPGRPPGRRWSHRQPDRCAPSYQRLRQGPAPRQQPSADDRRSSRRLRGPREPSFRRALRSVAGEARSWSPRDARERWRRPSQGRVARRSLGDRPHCSAWRLPFASRGPPSSTPSLPHRRPVSPSFAEAHASTPSLPHRRRVSPSFAEAHAACPADSRPARQDDQAYRLAMTGVRPVHFPASRQAPLSPNRRSIRRRATQRRARRPNAPSERRRTCNSPARPGHLWSRSAGMAPDATARRRHCKTESPPG